MSTTFQSTTKDVKDVNLERLDSNVDGDGEGEGKNIDDVELAKTNSQPLATVEKPRKTELGAIEGFHENFEMV